MAKLRMRMVLEAEYEANPVDYGTYDPKEMAEIDRMNLEDDWEFHVAAFDPTVNIEVWPTEAESTFTPRVERILDASPAGPEESTRPPTVAEWHSCLDWGCEPGRCSEEKST